MDTVYLDEAGNTGANLFDADQPIFVLASNDFAADEARALLEHVRGSKTEESKFTLLKRRPEGVNRLIRFLTDPILNRHRVSIDVYHKRYMVVTKLVDLIAETLMHAKGEDLYQRGGNIAMANMLYYCMPAFCGEDQTTTFLKAFVNLIRRGPTQHYDDFYTAGRNLVNASTDEKFKSHLFFFTEPALFENWYGGSDSSMLDPAIPALFQQIVVWGERKTERFDVLHDRSKPILATQAIFEAMMAIPDEESKIIGTDRRKIKFPLRAASLTQADSVMYPQLQVADLCAGAINHFYKMHIAEKQDALSQAVETLGCLEWGKDFILPQPHVTPESLGTNDESGTNTVKDITDYLNAKLASTYKS